MAQVEFKINIETSDPRQVVAAMEFLAALSGGVELPKKGLAADIKPEPEAVEEVKAEKKKTVKRTPKIPKKVEPEAVEETQENEPGAVEETQENEPEAVEETPETVEAEETPENDISIEEVRRLLSLKVNDHRSELRAKLTKLGATSVSTLDKSKYGEFVTFLNGL